MNLGSHAGYCDLCIRRSSQSHQEMRIGIGILEVPSSNIGPETNMLTVLLKIGQE